MLKTVDLLVSHGLSGSLRGLGLFSELTQDFVWTGVLDFVLGCFLLPLRGWGLVGVELCLAVSRELKARSRLRRLLDCSFEWRWERFDVVHARSFADLRPLRMTSG